MMITDAPRRSAAPGNGWRNTILVTWVGVFACTLAVAVSSRTIGRPVWWLGPGSDPAPVVFLAVPVVIVLLPLAAAVRAPRLAVRFSLLCSVLLALAGVPDAGDRIAIAIATWTVAGTALLSTIAVMVGARQYR